MLNTLLRGRFSLKCEYLWATLFLCASIQTCLTLAENSEDTTKTELERMWPDCIIRIGDYFAPKSPTEYNWLPNSCSYSVFRALDVRREILFRKNEEYQVAGRKSTTAIAFAGDSTGLRDFTQAINMVAAPVEIKTIYKVASVPARWPIVTYDPPFSTGEVDDGGLLKETSRTHPERDARNMANITYYNMRYAFFAENVLREEIRRVCSAPDNKGGFFFVTLGNWDLNWKTHKKERVPGLARKFDFQAATAYWTHYVGRMFVAIHEEGEACRSTRRSDGTAAVPPTVIVREQFMPNCAAPRFSASKHRKFKQCTPFLVPVVIPMYRRVLRGVGWAMGVPVVPTDHMFREGYKYCGISDGLHLDPQCMDMEQQLLWNVAKLMATVGSANVQAWGSTKRSKLSGGDRHSHAFFSSTNYTKAIEEVARLMVNETEYARWMRFLGLQSLYDGQPAAQSPPVQATLEPSHSEMNFSTNAPRTTRSESDDEGIVLEVRSFTSNASFARKGDWAHTIGQHAVLFLNIGVFGLIVLVVREIRKGPVTGD